MLSYHYGWDIEYILNLSVPQFELVLEGLSEILRQKYDPDANKQEEFEKQAKLSEIKAQVIKTKKEKKERISDKPFKVKLEEL